MTVFLERYVLPFLSGVTLLVMFTNPLHLSWEQRIIGSLIAVLVAALASYAAQQASKKAQSSIRVADSASAKSGGGRLLLTVEPEYLMGFFREHTTIQAQNMVAVYLGKWMRVSGKLGDVDASSQSYVFVSLRRSGEMRYLLLFDKNVWKDHLAILRRGDVVTAVGQLRDVDRDHLTLEQCELEDSSGETILRPPR